MDTALVLVKTPKGVDEIKRRSGDLPQTMRPLLIMVDGHTNVANFLRKTAQFPQVLEHLEWLLQQGYVQPTVNTKLAGTISTPQADAPMASEGSLKPALITLAEKLLGAQATKVVERLNDAPDSREELSAAVGRRHKLIKLAIDESKADSFLRASRDLLAKAP